MFGAFEPIVHKFGALLAERYFLYTWLHRIDCVKSMLLHTCTFFLYTSKQQIDFSTPYDGTIRLFQFIHFGIAKIWLHSQSSLFVTEQLFDLIHFIMTIQDRERERDKGKEKCTHATNLYERYRVKSIYNFYCLLVCHYLLLASSSHPLVRCCLCTIRRAAPHSTVCHWWCWWWCETH